MTKVEIISIGDELGIILPQQVLKRLGFEGGDDFVVSETAYGIELKPLEPAELRAMRRVAREHSDVLKRLADS